MKILFLQSGGTIDKAYSPNDDNHGYNFEISTPAFERILRRIQPGFEYEMQLIARKDSTELNDTDRRAIHDACASSTVTHIVLTHGTDTMSQTAAVLADIPDKTIVITGAFEPERFKGSDADFNLGCAVGAITHLPNGVYIAMNGLVLPWQEISFDDATKQFKQV